MTEISLDGRGRVHVERIVFALDCGITINPDLIRAQVEGGIDRTPPDPATTAIR